MPLELKLNFKAVSDDCKTVTVEDITGPYDDPDNLGGYGGGVNPERNVLALYLIGQEYNPETGFYDFITIDNPDPENAAEWTFDSDKDAYYPITVAAFGLYDPGVSYAADTIVYQSGVGFFSSLINGNLGNVPDVSPAEWAPTTEEQLLKQIKDKAVPLGILNLVTSCRAANCYSKATVAVSQGTLKENCNCTSENLEEWQRVHVLWNGLVTLILQQRYTEAGSVAATLADICEYLDCDCGC